MWRLFKANLSEMFNKIAYKHHIKTTDTNPDPSPYPDPNPFWRRTNRKIPLKISLFSELNT